MEVAGEVEVDVLHRHHLRLAAACGSALHPETGAERRFTEAEQGALADPVHCVCQSDTGCGLAFASRCRVDRGDQDQLAIGL